MPSLPCRPVAVRPPRDPEASGAPALRRSAGRHVMLAGRHSGRSRVASPVFRSVPPGVRSLPFHEELSGERTHMSVSSVSNNLSIQDLAAQLTARFDANKDGQLSVSEFANVMTTLLGAASPASAARASGAASAATASLGRSAVGVMAGFDATKLADATHTSFKVSDRSHSAGLSEYAAGAARRAASNPAAGAWRADRRHERRQTRFRDVSGSKDGSIGVVDVLQGAGIGGVAWQWMPVTS